MNIMTALLLAWCITLSIVVVTSLLMVVSYCFIRIVKAIKG